MAPTNTTTTISWNELEDDEHMLSMKKTEKADCTPEMENYYPVPTRRRRNSWLLSVDNQLEDNIAYKEDRDSLPGSPIDVSTAAGVVVCDLEDFVSLCSDIVHEFFSSYDVVEATRALMELESSCWHKHFVETLIRSAMDHRDKEREATNQLLEYAMQHAVLTPAQLSAGFNRLLVSLPDLTLDVPHAGEMLEHFVTRAITDGLLNSGSFLSQSYLNNEMATGVLKSVSSALKRQDSHPTLEFEETWGLGDGRPVVELKATLDHLISDFLCSFNTKAFIASVSALDVPFFHHEAVKRIIRKSLDRNATVRRRCWNLISLCHHQNVFSSKQIAMGFKHLFDLMSDIVLDTPAAENLLINEFLVWAEQDHCIPTSEITALMV